MAKKAAFAAASFANLRAAAGEGDGEPLRIALVDIDEDPNQPRKAFNEAELEVLAETIRMRGVLQPVGLLPPEKGRYTLAFGARRFRASKLAGMADIPAVIVPSEQRDFATQIIENQQRADLSNSELAAAVNQLHAEGKRGREIAAICALKDYQVAAFRAVERLPGFLVDRLDTGDIRAIYDLYRAWQKQPAAIEDAMPEADAFLTITEARRIIAAATGKPSGSIVLSRERQAEAISTDGADDAGALPASAPIVAQPSDADAAPPRVEQTGPKRLAEPARDERPEPLRPEQDLHGANVLASPELAATGQQEAGEKRPTTGSAAGPAPDKAMPVFIMEMEDGLRGVLVTTRRPDQSGSAFLDVKGDLRVVPFAKLRTIAAM